VRGVRWLGHEAVEMTNPGGVVRAVFADRYFVVATVVGRNGDRAKPEEEAAFFDNFELTN